MKTPLKDFTKKVISIVKKIPRGKVATYGQIAALAGKPHAARGISWILHSQSEEYKLPWQRVINSRGRISFRRKSPQYKLQKSLLVAERVEFDRDESVSLIVFGWNKKAARKRGAPRMFS
jgi:methylated-DNA-protein-cysteine methyltransferase-like protein